MYSAYLVADPVALCLMAAGFPVAAFLIIYCGMPASVVACGGGCQKRHCTGEQYDLWHTVWHITSGLGKADRSNFADYVEDRQFATVLTGYCLGQAPRI